MSLTLIETVIRLHPPKPSVVDREQVGYFSDSYAKKVKSD